MNIKPQPVCADIDADCFEVENKHTCWLHDISRGYCPWLQHHRMFAGKLVSCREDREPIMVHEDGRFEVLALDQMRP